MTSDASRTVVVKIGGNSLGPEDTTFADVVRLQQEGTRVIVVHGGGPAVTDWLERTGVETRFVDGHRVTDESTLEVVTAVLSGLVNKSIVADIQAAGGNAAGVSGSDGPTVIARVRDETLGRVGDVVAVKPELLDVISAAGMIPIVSPVSREEGPLARVLNVNADSVAGALAEAVQADRLVFLTDVSGVFDAAGETIPALDESRARGLIADGVVSGGMIPKVEACLTALRHAATAQIVDGRQSGALMAALESGAGTVISRDAEA
ncbi:MAG: acetylglutamate kinase [Dehalococcoidia bacterium]|jgi:acetylglutamate kinase|nr:acetylglutamate kinase [Dehalococcoidia bacterium]